MNSEHAEAIGREHSIEPGLAITGHAVERARVTCTCGELIVAKEEDRPAQALEIVLDREVLEAAIIRDRAALLIETDDAGARLTRQLQGIDADAGHRIADHHELRLHLANRIGGRLRSKGSRGRGVSMVGR